MWPTAESYDKVVSSLRPVREYFSSAGPGEEEILTKLADDIRAAKSDEEAGIQRLKDFLRTHL
jgi:hypothetical protein